MKTLKQSLFMVACLGGVASGNAFNINEHDAKVTGRGGASAASNTDPSSIVFNPGGIPVAEGTQVAIGGSLYIATGSYEPARWWPQTKTDSSPSIVPSIYLTSRVHDMVAVGLGVHLPFGLAVSWPDRHAAGRGDPGSGAAHLLHHAVGRRQPRQAGAGPVDRRRRGPRPRDDQARARHPVRRRARHGGARRRCVRHRRSGRRDVPPASGQGPQARRDVAQLGQARLRGQGRLRHRAAVSRRSCRPTATSPRRSRCRSRSAGGVAYSPLENLELEFNAVWINWSNAWKNDELRIELPGTDAMGNPNATVAPQNYDDTVTLRFGAEYQLPKYKTAVRAGFIYDPTPIPPTTQTAQLPDVNRKNVTLGASYTPGQLRRAPRPAVGDPGRARHRRRRVHAAVQGHVRGAGVRDLADAQRPVRQVSRASPIIPTRDGTTRPGLGGRPPGPSCCSHELGLDQLDRAPGARPEPVGERGCEQAR